MTASLCSLVARVIVAACLLVPLAHADVIVVDQKGAPGADATDFAGALALAQPGDTLLFRTGNYFVSAVDGVPLTLAADEGADVDFSGTLIVRNLAADEQLVLRGLELRGAIFDDDALRIEASSQGTVLVELCQLFGPPTTNGVAVTHAGGDLLTVQSSYKGFGGDSPDPSAGSALVITGGRVFAYDCSFSGGAGAGFGLGDPDGEPAVRVLDGALDATACTLTGGTGGAGFSLGGPCSDGGEGGPALELLSAGASALLRGATLQGGAGGATHVDCPPGSAGASVANPGGGAVASLPHTNRAWHATSPVREGEDVLLTFAGEPGDAILLALAPRLTALPVGPKGTLHLELPLTLLGFGSVPLEGVLFTGAVVPALPAGLEELVIPAQYIAFPASGGLRFGSARALVLLDASL